MEMQSQFRSSTESEDLPMPPKLVAKIDEYYREIRKVEIYRKDARALEKINAISLPRAQDGHHPDASAMDISQRVMQVIAADVASSGLASYAIHLWVADKSKRSCTLAKKDIAVLLAHDDSIIQDDQPSIEHAAFAMAQDGMAIVAQTMGEGLNQAYSHIENLMERLIESSRSQTTVVDGLQSLISTQTEQLHDAAIVKNDALSILYKSKVAETEAAASLERTRLAWTMASPGLLLLADRVATKYGFPLVSIMEQMKGSAGSTDESEPEADSAPSQASATPTQKPTTPSPAEAAEAAKMEELQRLLKTHPIVTRLSGVRESLTDEQWIKINALKPKKTVDALKRMLKCEDEKDGLAQAKAFVQLLTAKPALREAFEEILTDVQGVIVSEVAVLAMR